MHSKPYRPAKDIILLLLVLNLGIATGLCIHHCWLAPGECGEKQ